jgi:thiamine-monophosphate kinase
VRQLYKGTGMDREAQLIRRIARAIPSRSVGRGRPGIHAERGLRLGIGDDAAVVATGGGTEWVISCDAFLEGVHFLGARHPADSVGYKSLARAASDLVAMGATPRMFLLTLALPAGQSGAWLDRFLEGMSRAARELGMCLVGGDTSWSSTVSISITVVGEVSSGRAVRRLGARAGDIIYVSGRLGRSQLGLELVRKSGPRELKRIIKDQSRLMQPHLYPKIPVALGIWLGQQRVASAMMDISDGLSTDLARLCAASGVGARLWAERIPCVAIPGGIAKHVGKLKLDPLEMALNGGDDYELLFTVPRRRAKLLRGAPGFREMAAIGEIERGNQITLVAADGCARRLTPRGWNSFR